MDLPINGLRSEKQAKRLSNHRLQFVAGFDCHGRIGSENAEIHIPNEGILPCTSTFFQAPSIMGSAIERPMLSVLLLSASSAPADPFERHPARIEPVNADEPPRRAGREAYFPKKDSRGSRQKKRRGNRGGAKFRDAEAYDDGGRAVTGKARLGHRRKSNRPRGFGSMAVLLSAVTLIVAAIFLFLMFKKLAKAAAPRQRYPLAFFRQAAGY
jgi:hypothetical protein